MAGIVERGINFIKTTIFTPITLLKEAVRTFPDGIIIGIGFFSIVPVS